MLNFDEAAKELCTVAPGRVTMVSYNGLLFAMQCGIDIISDYAEMYTLQKLIADVGTPAQKQRLKEEIIAGRWSTEIMRAEQESAANTERNSDSIYHDGRDF